MTDASFSLVKGNPYPCYPAGDNVADTGFVFVFPYYYSETSQCVDKGDPATEPDHLDIDTLDELFNRTVHTSGALDTNPVDLGYHYLP